MSSRNTAHHPLSIKTLIIISMLLSLTVRAATTSATDGSTPLGLEPGAPAGAYALSGFENINLFNGSLSFQLSLFGVVGRGGAQMPVLLPIEGKWRVLDIAIPQPNGSVNHSYLPIQEWWENNDRKYRPGSLVGRQGSLDVMTCPDNTTISVITLRRLTFTAPDGTEYELRDQLTGGQPANNQLCDYLNPPSRGKVFVTADGSAATFVSESTISDYVVSPNPEAEFFPTGYLMLRDGTRFRIQAGRVDWMRDRNGNKLSFGYDGNNRVVSITDSLNRVVSISRNTGPGTFDEITYKGFGGAPRSVKVNYSSLASALRSDYLTTQTYKSLFPALDGSSTNHHNPSVVSSITLPNNQQYLIKYNPFGEIARVVLPTGGAIEYDYVGGVATGYEGSWVVYRRVAERRVYPDGASGPAFTSRMTYSSTEAECPGCVKVEQYNSAGQRLTLTKHYFYGNALSSFALGPTDYSGWKEGKEYKTEEFASDGTTELRRTVKTFEQPIAGGSWPLTQAETSDAAKTNNPQVTQSVNTLEPAQANKVSKQTFAYDKYTNPTDVYEYNFGTGAAGSLVRRTHTDYLTASYDTLNPNSTSPDLNQTSHLRSLPTQVSVFDAAGVERARSTMEYDNHVPEGSGCTNSFHCALLPRSSISGLDSLPYTMRGNPTAVTGYLLSNGTVTGSITSYSQFDVAGNVVRVIDPRSTLSNLIATTIEYDDRFGSPDNEARSNSVPSELTGFSSFAFPTKVINALGHTAYAQFDYCLGKTVNGEDANGVVAAGYFNDSLDRPKQIRRAIGTSAENQTTFNYNDTTRTITTFSDKDAVGDNLLVSEVLYDQMGRTIESRLYEGGTNTIVTKTEYDALGRPFKTSNPYRPWQNETALWTTQVFDALGRVKTVTTPDNAVVNTDYTGNSVTVTDQTGKKRSSVTDALGRLIEVYEDPNGVNYQTTYLYDVLDNLVKVTQGSQQRFFMYDSLKRLIRARNPEQSTLASLNLSDPITGNSAWSIAYQYDVSSNLTQKTDARGVVSTYAYDLLNRNTTTTYTNDPSGTLPITRIYDTATNGKGRLHKTETTGAAGSLTTIDAYDSQGRPTTQRQQFFVSGAWGSSYTTQRAYNRAGGVTSQTYPSGRTVTYTFDAANRISGLTGNLGDGTNRTYASGVIYSPFGGLSKEQLGTTTPLYNKLFYNNRGQLAEIRVGTTYTGPTDTGWERGAIINHYSGQCWGACTPTSSMTDNNGNLKQQDHFISDGNGGVQAVYVQTFDYDSLNRLQRVREGTWQQEYVYDRWGNRTISQANTYGSGIPKPNFGVDTANNRLTAPAGFSMTYDAAGNLTNDTYTGAGNRTYDAENKIISAWGGNNQAQLYKYDANGQRIKRTVDGIETWQVYGFAGELLAEYPANGATASPQKEYGYRNGQMLITASSGATSLGLKCYSKFDENSGTTAADSSGNGNTGTLTSGTGWATGQNGSATNFDGVDDYVQVGAQSSLVMTSAASLSAWIYPTGAGSNATYGGTIMVKEGEYIVARYPNGKIHWGFANSNPGWTFVDTGYVAPLNQWTHITVTYDNGTIKTYANGGLVHTHNGSGAIGDAITGQNDFRVGGRQAISQHFQGRIDEVRVYNRALSASEVSSVPNGSLNVKWLVADHLGTPRIIIDQTGSLANVKRHDYLPFGEELFASTGGRSAAQGYGCPSGQPGCTGDQVRQQFTSKERDVETGLDYFLARYYSSTQGRFTSVDPGSFVPADPQSWNRYLYTQNNPLKFTDPTGEDLYITGDYADGIVADLERFSGLKLQRDSKTGKVTIDPKQKRKGKGTSYALAAALGRAIGNEKVSVSIQTVSESKNNLEIIGDRFIENKLDIDDYKVYKRDAPEFAAGFLTHVVTEYYEAQLLPAPLSLETIFKSAHNAGLETESDTVGDFNGWWQQPRREQLISGSLNSPTMTVRFIYSTVEYDVVYKSGAGGHATQAYKVTKIDKTPKKPKK